MVSVVENFSSFVWTDRYYSAGDFELYVPPTIRVLTQYIPDYYVVRPDSEHVMIIDSVLLEEDDDGYSYKISGESLESILKRRILWTDTTLSGNFQDAIETLLNGSIISPSIADRKIDNFVFVKSEDEAITSLTIEEAEYSKDETIYDIIEKNCQEFEIGFKVTLTSDNKFAFTLYKGVDRSYDQTAVPYVIFSPAFDNLTSSSFLKSYTDYKNVALVTGTKTVETIDEETGTETSETVDVSATVGEASGLDRRETHIDGGSIQGDTSVLTKKGNEELAALKKTEAFEGEANVFNMFVYGKDFFIGDMVQLEDAFGNTGKSIVSEMVFSSDGEGEKFYPTFIVPEEDGDEEE